jgi:hypothetical protein
MRVGHCRLLSGRACTLLNAAIVAGVARTPGDMAVFVTDGVTEVLENGIAELSAALMKRRREGRLPTAEAACRVVVDLAAHATPPVEGRYDDRTVVVCRRANAGRTSSGT